jgi:tetratricopeptide (TPR) repeat protein
LWPTLDIPLKSGGVLTRKFAFIVYCAALSFTASGKVSAQSTKAQLEVSETFFTMAAALNSCGYDAGLEQSLFLRKSVREEVEAAVGRSPQAAQARDAICQFWREHEPDASSRDITQYISLALELGGPPEFLTALPQADLPPDAAHVLGMAPLLRKFHQAAGLHLLWEKHRKQYDSLVLQFHDQLSEAITETDRYLKLAFTNYPGQRFVVFLEPQLSPSHVDSRNYGSNYFSVVSPGQDGQLRLAEIRHTYLHFVLEPMALAHGGNLKRLEPILFEIKSAPLNDSYKNDVSLLVNESLIRAIEVRLAVPKINEAGRLAYVQHSMEEGFVLTHYFYEALAAFERDSTGMKDAYGDLLYNIDVDRERKRARQLVFAAQATPEVISSSKAFSAPSLLDAAEQKLAMGDVAAAQKIAEQVAQHNSGGDEPGRAAFIMARIATLAGNMEEARIDFQQAAQSVHDPRVLAWSHIYLGRIFDIQQQREAALAEYRAALAAGDAAPDTKAAAERGLEMPYQARAPR